MYNPEKRLSIITIISIIITIIIVTIYIKSWYFSEDTSQDFA